MIAGMENKPQNQPMTLEPTKLALLKELLSQWGQEAGFAEVGVTDIDLHEHKEHYLNWLQNKHHGSMEYMAKHYELRIDPSKLQEKCLKVISFRMEYRHLTENVDAILEQSDRGYISRYALGRDYHKLIRKSLSKIAKRIEEFAQLNLNQRAFVDSAPVLERALAEKAGLGWIGKNTMLINAKAGSWFFLAEILTDLDIPNDSPNEHLHCGSCTACLESCPTNAFKGAHELDARRCISYLTIENKGPIPEEFREAIGNRIYGCDDCQIVCPWNKFSPESPVSDFKPRPQLLNRPLHELFLWSEAEFLKHTEGSPIRRIGYERWLRNIAVALGNSLDTMSALSALQQQLGKVSPMLDEHINWAIKRL